MVPHLVPAITLSIPLRGAGGEPVAFRQTLTSHGLAWLPPNEIADDEAALETTLLVGSAGARRVRFASGPASMLDVAVRGARLGARDRTTLERIVRTMFSLDEDLAAFYEALERDVDLRFACEGIGRMLRSPTAFEDVVRTICTTNCAWSGTRRMITAMVQHLGTPAPGAPHDDWRGRAFPTPAQIAAAGDDFFRDVARAGYRGPYFGSLAREIENGALDLEAWRSAEPSDLPDDELEKLLLALPGVGPYAAAHIMMLFGRCSRLVLDSWTRPRYAQLVGKKTVSDKTIARRFKPYADHAGRAFWLFLWKPRHLGTDASPLVP
jgi:N-glycosylase/DNA lyase